MREKQNKYDQMKDFSNYFNSKFISYQRIILTLCDRLINMDYTKSLDNDLILGSYVQVIYQQIKIINQSLSHIMNHDQVQIIYEAITQKIQYIINDQFATCKLGFSFNQLIWLRKNHENKLDKISNKILDSIISCKSLKVTGGTLSVSSGTMGLAGILLAPLTGGLSIGLTVLGGLTGLASAASSFLNTIQEKGIIQDFQTLEKLLKQYQEDAVIFFNTIQQIEQLFSEFQKIEVKRNQQPPIQKIRPLIPKNDIDVAKWVENLRQCRAKFYNYRMGKKMISLQKKFSKISDKVAKDTQARRLIDLIAQKKSVEKGLKAVNQVNLMTRFAFSAGKGLSGIFCGISIISGVVQIRNATQPSHLQKEFEIKQNQIKGYKELTNTISTIKEEFETSARYRYFNVKNFAILIILIMALYFCMPTFNRPIKIHPTRAKPRV